MARECESLGMTDLVLPATRRVARCQMPARVAGVHGAERIRLNVVAAPQEAAARVFGDASLTRV
jgi:hypothetical protein